MQSQLFRKKTLERISSPEQLQDYMRVTNPGIWLVLGAVIALLAGLIVASALFRVETTVAAQGKVAGENHAIVMELSKEAGADVREGMTVKAAGQTGRVSYVYRSGDAVVVSAELDAGAEPLPEGVYDVQIVTETLSPISFLLD